MDRDRWAATTGGPRPTLWGATGPVGRGCGILRAEVRVRSKLLALAATRAPRVAERVARRAVPGFVPSPPRWLVLGVNNACNLHCRMCDVGTGDADTTFGRNLLGSHPMHMPVELFQRIVDQAVRHAPQARFGYAFTEPLVYKHLDETLRIALSAGRSVAITTNGLTLAQRSPMLEGVADLYLSLDGPAAVHDSIRGHAGAFDRALAGVEALGRLRNPPQVRVFCTITPWNTGELVALAEALRGLPIRELGLMHANFTTEAVAAAHNAAWPAWPATPSNITELDPAAVDTDALWDELVALRATPLPFPVTEQPTIGSRDDLVRYYRDPTARFGRRCGDVRAALMIKSDGRVIAAHGRCFDRTLGNLHTDELDAIWNGEGIAGLRRDLARAGGLLPACTRCCSAFAR